MRAVTIGALVFAFLIGAQAHAQPTNDAGAIPRLVEPCPARVNFECPVGISIEGAITAETARSFVLILEAEQKRSGATLRPKVTIVSTGGDLLAAMSMGREIRKRMGAVVSSGPCHSACVFVTMGGVERTLAGIGLHRPFFADFSTNSFVEADSRYKKMLGLVAGYLGEMNIAEDLLRAMVAIPPGDMRLLQTVEARRIGLVGVDPAYEEFITGREAARFGITSAEYRRREGTLDAQCGREGDMRSLPEMRKRDECRAKSRERILWGLDEQKFALLKRATEEHCYGAMLDNQDREKCILQLAHAIRRQP